MSETLPLLYEGNGLFRLQSFLKRVEQIPFSTCWYWIGGLYKDGYGKIWHTGKEYKAHRYSYELHNGPIPFGMHVCHKCDVPSCVNPDHLFVGTRNDNMHDMAMKGRSTHSERHHRAKLSIEQVREIRAKRYSGQSVKNLAAEYGVSKGRISEIVHQKTWRRV